MEDWDGQVTTAQPVSSFGFDSKSQMQLPGLETLTNMKELTIKQLRPGCLELLNCWEYSNKYKAMDEDGNQLYFLQEESSCLMRSCCANSRELQVSFQTNDGQEILRFNRPLRCMECCSDCCYPNWTQLLEVYHQDQLLGCIREAPVCCFSRKHLEVWDKNEQKIYDISGPCCPFSCGGDVPFPIENQAGIALGEISKKWRGCGAEAFTDMDTFKIEFPDNIDLATKALLLGATMLVVSK